ncbi:MAG: outer membrane beta-barrel protein [Vicinamibacterales bacterium]
MSRPACTTVLNAAIRAVLPLTLLLMARPALAQESEPPADPLDNALVRVGPLGINPSILLSDVGRDENVFNDATTPKSDFTFTLTPKAEVLFRPRLVHVDFTEQTEYVYYQTYASERSVNESSGVRADFDLSRFQPFVSVQGVTTRDRLDQEVDVRARHHQVTYLAGVALKLATRTRVSADVSRASLTFDTGSLFRGFDLATAFDGHVETIEASVGLDVTPFTSVSLAATRNQQRFTLAPDRNSETTRIAPTVTFSSLAIISGSASVGYSTFQPSSASVPGWSGLSVVATLSTADLGRYRFDGTFTRDVRYSYDLTTPYYVTAGGTINATILLVGPFDAKLTATRQSMQYRQEQTAATAAGLGGTDTYTDYGGGFGYRIRDRLRVGITVDWGQRASDISLDRTYHDHRILASFTWGALQ